MVDALYEPMVHMIRNSVDHGLETPEERHKKNKPPVGTITLTANHKSGTIIIEISDDGSGLDRDKIVSKAVLSGMIQPDDSLSDSEIDQLILNPGFSTSESVTDISGRGVGMDVVVTSIENLRGSLDIQSRPGRGSKFIITLPLTLAIIDGMILDIVSLFEMTLIR